MTKRPRGVPTDPGPEAFTQKYIQSCTLLTGKQCSRISEGALTCPTGLTDYKGDSSEWKLDPTLHSKLSAVDSTVPGAWLLCVLTKPRAGPWRAGRHLKPEMLEGPGSPGSLWRAGELAWGSSSASYVYFKCAMYVTKLLPEVSQWHFSPLGAGEGGKRNGGVPNTSRRLLCMGSASSLMVQLPSVGGGSWGWAAESVLSWSLAPAPPA